MTVVSRSLEVETERHRAGEGVGAAVSLRGRVAEWFIAAVLKTVGVTLAGAPVGSNPTPPAPSRRAWRNGKRNGLGTRRARTPSRFDSGRAQWFDNNTPEGTQQGIVGPCVASLDPPTIMLAS